MRKRIPSISLMLVLIMIVAAFAGCSSARNMSAATPQAAPAMDMAPSANRLGGVALSNRASDYDLTEPRALGEVESQKWNLLVAANTEDSVDMEDSFEPAEADDSGALTGGGVAGPSVTPVVDARKIIKNVNLGLQTLTFDAGVESIPKIAESFGGYVQDSYVDGRDMYNERGTRSASFTVRIPVEQLDSFLDSVGGEFHVTSKSQNSQDITESYYDSKARLDALKIQEERLLEMLKQAAELEYLLQVEKELMNVRYEIESLTASLNRMDSYVSMSTVMINLIEVVKYEPVENVPVTFGERMLRAFQESWKSFGEFAQDFAVWFVAAFPFLLLLAVIALVIIGIIRSRIKRSKATTQHDDVPPMPTPAAPSVAAPAELPPTKKEKK